MSPAPFVRAAVLAALAALPAAAQSSDAAPDAPPRLANAAEVREALPAFYPDTLRALRVGAPVRLRLRVDEDGSVGAAEVMRSSSFPSLDAAALSLAEMLRFEPARVDGRAVRQWVEFPVEFQPPIPVEPLPLRGRMSAGPRLLNLRELRATHTQHCRRSRHTVEGRVSIFIGTDGLPLALYLLAPSGDAAMDQSLVHVAMLARFSPARLEDGTPVPVWVGLPLHCEIG